MWRKWSFLPRYSVERAKPLLRDSNIYRPVFRRERTRILRVNGDLQEELVTRDSTDSFDPSTRTQRLRLTVTRRAS